MNRSMPRKRADELFDAAFAAKWGARQGLDGETRAVHRAVLRCLLAGPGPVDERRDRRRSRAGARPGRGGAGSARHRRFPAGVGGPGASRVSALRRAHRLRGGLRRRAALPRLLCHRRARVARDDGRARHHPGDLPSLRRSPDPARRTPGPSRLARGDGMDGRARRSARESVRSEEHVGAWWAARPAVSGAAATLAEGFKLAARVFGDLLQGPAATR